MSYNIPQIKVHSVYDIQQDEALAVSATCQSNNGSVCGVHICPVHICPCMSFCFIKK